MKTILLGLLLLLSLTSIAQKGLSQLTPLSAYKIIDLRGQSGIAVDDTGRVWMSFSGYQATKIKYVSSTLGLLSMGSDSTWKQIKLDSLGGPKTTYLTGIEFIDHALWMGSDKGLIQKKGNVFNVYKNPAPHLPGDTVNGFCLKGNAIYLAMQNGLHVCSNITGQVWNQYDTTNSTLPTNKIFAVDVQNDGIVWLATNKGVVRYDAAKNESRIFNKNNSEFWTDTILCIKVLPNGDVWAGSVNSASFLTDPYTSGYNLYPGIFKWVGGKFKNLISLLGLCDFEYITKNSFNQIYNEGNKILFNGSVYKGNYFGYYSALYETDGQTLSRKPYLPKPFVLGDRILMTRAGNKYFLSKPYDAVQILDLNTYTEDSSYYYKKHGVDSATKNPIEISSALTINNVYSPIQIRGDLFTDDLSFEKGLSGEKGNCKKIATAAALWMGGIANGNLHLAAETYRQSGLDYAAGPLKKLNAGLTTDSKIKFNHAWKVEQRTIETFKLNYNKPGYIIPEEILSWPAHGDSANGFAANLAPFNDINNNGKYEPIEGDYPLIKGQQQLFWIFNDRAPIHSESEGMPLGVEVHGSSYAYVCDKVNAQNQDKAINNTVFFHYKIVNRSDTIYRNFKVGFWLDYTIGYSIDDRMGSNPKDQYAYWFNGDTLDETFHGFGNKLPGVAIVMLKGMKDSLNADLKIGGMMSFNANPSVNGFPTQAEHYYSYLNNKWKDGLSVTYGGNGRGGSDSMNVFMFPGNNDILNRPVWDEESNIDLNVDSRILLNTQGITLKPGEEQEVEYAIIYTPTNSNDKEFILAELHKDVMKVKGWYAANNFPSCSTIPLSLMEENINNKVELLLSPNPASQNIYLELSNADPIKAISVYSLSGMLVMNVKGTDIKKIDLSSVAAGLYFIKAESMDMVYVKKVIKE
ncbi:MAG: T9SS type A sorting domain-containing protein [Bacteroidia bacterium]|nr:T9SS type A sorting domain-containing protein [Bacteroidia bacterium]